MLPCLCTDSHCFEKAHFLMTKEKTTLLGLLCLLHTKSEINICTFELFMDKVKCDGYRQIPKDITLNTCGVIVNGFAGWNWA